MSLAEALGGAYWITQIAAAPSIYKVPIVKAGVILLFAFVTESLIASFFDDETETRLIPSLSLGIGEVFVWTQWSIIVTVGLWSATGIGPATVIFFILLSLFHIVETDVLYGERHKTRNILTAFVEAVSITAAWVIFIETGSVLFLTATLFAGLTLEHAHRLTDRKEAQEEIEAAEAST